MAVNKILSIKSVIKGYHVYRVCYSVGTKHNCFLEPENEHSDCAIIVQTGDTTVYHLFGPREKKRLVRSALKQQIRKLTA